MAKVAVIGSAGVPANYGGFETFVENLIEALGSDYDFTVYCSAKAYEEQAETFKNARLRYSSFGANGFQSIPYDISCMLHAWRVERADILLVLGVSGCIFLPLLKLLSRRKVIVHVGGIEWKRDKWGWLPKAVLRFSERIAARFADVLIADNLGIRKHLLERYGKQSFLAAYGGDHVVREPAEGEAAAPVPEIPFDRYALSVCRIEPENNIRLIIQAFADTAAMPLVFMGNWEASEYGRALRAEFGDRSDILLLDPCYDLDFLYQLRVRASLYVHGHTVGGTNPSLVEAMFIGLPVLAFDNTYNRATTRSAALFFNGPEQLRSCLLELDPEGLSAVGSGLQEIAFRDYTWAEISSRYAALFDTLLGLPRSAGKIATIPLDFNELPESSDARPAASHAASKHDGKTASGQGAERNILPGG